MPIHVDRRDRDRQFFALEAAHQIEIFLLRIRLVAAPPIAQRIARQQRHVAAQLEKVCDTTAVIAAVRKEIEVAARRSLHDLVAAQYQSVRVVHHRDAAARDKPVFERHRPVAAVQRAARPLEVALAEVAHPPAVLQDDLDHFALSDVVDKPRIRGDDLDDIAALSALERRLVERASPNALSRLVAKRARLHTEQTRRKHCEAHVADRQHLSCRACRRHVDLESLHNSLICGGPAIPL